MDSAVGMDGTEQYPSNDASEPGMSARPRILVVDDDRLVRELACDLLLEEGYPVEMALGAGQALEMLRHASPGHFHLVVLDLYMPGMSGQEALPEILALCPDIKVILMSALDADSDIKSLLRPGRVGFICKTRFFDSFVPKVRQMLSEP